MIEGFLNFLQSPEFLTFAATYAGTKLLDAAGSKIKQLKSQSKQKTPEWQFIRCLELAFFITETELGWEHKTESIYESFEESLLTHQGSFTLASLKSIFETAIGHSVTEEQLEIWVKNFKRELAMGEYPELLKFINIDHYFQSQSMPVQSETKYILTPNSSVCENKDIIGRDFFIDNLLKTLEVKNSRIQITGMGGLGKTETLSKLFAQLASNKETSFFDHIAFIRFSGDILSNIQSQVYCPPNYLGLQGIEATKKYLQDICQEKKVLLCLDDIREKQPLLDDHDPNIEFLRSLGASILLAARASFPGFEAHDLEFLPIDECIKIFERQYGQSVTDEKDLEILKGIIENRAGNHTMVVNRLGSMAKIYSWSIPVLSEKLEKKDFNFAKSMSNDELLQQEIKKLYQINDTLSEAEKNLLEAFSVFPAVPLPVEICVVWLHEDAGVDEDNCARLLNRLAEQTWLEKRCGNNSGDVSFLMHQLVRTAVQEQSVIKPTSHQNLAESCSVSLYESAYSYKLAESYVVLLFAKSIMAVLQYASIPFAKLSGEIGYFYITTADYSVALIWFQKSLEICDQILGDDHLDVSAIFNNIGFIYKNQGEYNLALEWYNKALDSCDSEQDEDLALIATFNNNIGIVYNLLGKYKLALNSFLKSLSIRERVLEKDHPEIAQTYNNMASVLDDLGLSDLALDWNRKALQIKEKALPSNHPSTAMTYNNMGCIYNGQGDCFLALELHQKALAIRETVLGKEHPDTAMSYDNIARVYYQQKKYNLAIEWYEKALAIYEAKLGPEHPETKNVKANISEIEKKLRSHDS